VPGPGCYESSQPYIKTGPSISKKGYSNAFISKAYRLRSVYKNDLEVGPGDYDFDPYDRLKDKHKDRVSFLPNGDRNGRVPFADPLPYPGVGEYNVHIEPGEYDRSKKLKSATFRSQSKRDSYLIGQQGIPAVGEYTPNEDLVKFDRSTYFGKSKHTRFQDLGVDNKVPGPTRYFDEGRDQTEETGRMTSSGRIMGRTYSPKGKQNESPSAALHTFGADVERFKHSFCGRLDLAAEMPGPGWYSPMSAGDLVPRTAGSVGGHPVTESPTFRMKGPRTASFIKPVQHRAPGPAYYNAKAVDMRTVPLNPDGRWC
jgi:hypothetical protein